MLMTKGEWFIVFTLFMEGNPKSTAPFSFPTPRIPLNSRSADPLCLSITTTPYMAKPEEFETVYEGTIEFEEAANAMAEQCFLYSYQGVFYNMPTQRDLNPPFYCVTRGRYIGVFPACLW